MSRPKGEAALHAAHLASPQPPTNNHEVIFAMGYLSTHRFELFDENQDGALTPDEWLEAEFAACAVYNVKRDGRLLLEEFAQTINGPTDKPFSVGAQPLHRIEAQFRALDRGHKGYLTIEDFRERAMKTFRLNDVNRNGLVTKAEIDEVKRARRVR
jgi:hypothetical protein